MANGYEADSLEQYDDTEEPLYGNNDAINFHHIISSGKLVNSSSDVDSEESYYDDFTDEEEIEENTCQQLQTKQEENSQHKQEENIQGDNCTGEDDYLVVLSSSPQRSNSQIQKRWPPCPPQPLSNSSQCSHGQGLPRELQSLQKELDFNMKGVLPNTLKRGKCPVPLYDDHVIRGPAPLPDQSTSSQNKKLSFHEENSQNKLLPFQKADLRNRVLPFGGNVTNASAKVPPASCQTLRQGRNLPAEFVPVPPVSLSQSKEVDSSFMKLENGEKIVLTPLYRRIMQKHYFQFISRNYAGKLIKKGGDGSFVIRPSTRSDNPLTITVNHGGNIYNINIRQRPDNLYALGAQKYDEETFCTIDEIVNTYNKNPIRLKHGAVPLLKRCPMKASISHAQHIPASRRNQS